jgi:hypothetical protein
MDMKIPARFLLKSRAIASISNAGESPTDLRAHAVT